MIFASLRDPSRRVSFSDAVRTGLASDGGLFMPVRLPHLSAAEIAALKSMTPTEISLSVGKTLFAGDIDASSLERIITETVAFSIPLVRLDDRTCILELFHGPTLAFKDVGARFLARVLPYLFRGERSRLTVLVATSGDTGGAVAQGFFGVEGVEVVVLYPSGKVSPIQESQFSTLGGNVTALEVEGTFDDCQALVKRALSDRDLAQVRTMTSANSINIARLLPQTFYYFIAHGLLGGEDSPPVYSVPAGNLGNLTAGVMARAMGLPSRGFVAASNVNDVLPEYLRTGRLRVRPSIRTLSNAMDVGDPSNLPRLEACFDGDAAALRKVVHGTAWTDAATTETIHEVFNAHGYVLDPHSAVAYRAWQEYQRANGSEIRGVVLATAHPAKFLEAYEGSLRAAVKVPARLGARVGMKKLSVRMAPVFEHFKAFLSET